MYKREAYIIFTQVETLLINHIKKFQQVRPHFSLLAHHGDSGYIHRSPCSMVSLTHSQPAQSHMKQETRNKRDTCEKWKGYTNLTHSGEKKILTVWSNSMTSPLPLCIPRLLILKCFNDGSLLVHPLMSLHRLRVPT
jgi:hypothetical protein